MEKITYENGLFSQAEIRADALKVVKELGVDAFLKGFLIRYDFYIPEGNIVREYRNPMYSDVKDDDYAKNWNRLITEIYYLLSI